jgi:hypothetical protein
MEENKKTDCSCPLAGFCNRHGIEKSPHQHKLCQNSPAYFNRWEECRGPGQRFVECNKKESPTTIPAIESPQVAPILEKPHSMPSLWQQAKNLGSAIKQHAKSGFSHVSEETKQERLKVCSTCPFLSGDRCTKCGCHTPTKASWAANSCPAGYWKD